MVLSHFYSRDRNPRFCRTIIGARQESGAVAFYQKQRRESRCCRSPTEDGKNQRCCRTPTEEEEAGFKGTVALQQKKRRQISKVLPHSSRTSGQDSKVLSHSNRRSGQDSKVLSYSNRRRGQIPKVLSHSNRRRGKDSKVLSHSNNRRRQDSKVLSHSNKDRFPVIVSVFPFFVCPFSPPSGRGKKVKNHKGVHTDGSVVVPCKPCQGLSGLIFSLFYHPTKVVKVEKRENGKTEKKTVKRP